MTLLNKTSQARKEALVYCRRCLAVMVCCVLVFGLTVPAAPRAQAAFLEGAAIAGVAGGSDLASGALGLLMLVGLGDRSYSSSPVDSDLVGSDLVPEGAVSKWYSPYGYELGQKLYNSLLLLDDESIKNEVTTLLNPITEAGGFVAGQSFEFSAALGNAVRSWANENYPEAVSSADYFTYSATGSFIFSQVNPSTITGISSNNKMKVTSFGTLIPWSYCAKYINSYDGSDDWSVDISIVDDMKFVLRVQRSNTGRYSYSVTFSFKGVSEAGPAGSGSYDDVAAFKSYFHDYLLSGYDPHGVIAMGVAYVPSMSRYFVGAYRSDDGIFYSGRNKSVAVTDDHAPTSLISGLSAPPASADTYEKPITVTVPASLPTTVVDGLTVPVIEELAPADVVVTDIPATPTSKPGTGITAQDIAGAIGQAVPGAVADGIAQALPDVIAQSLPITGAIAGDQVVGEIAEDPDGLGAVFISKFPFCIPWDIVKAIQLLAAPPVTPRWELDFMQPIAGRVGGFQGSTKLVLDFSDYPIVGVATRWVSTVLFVYALASGTKRLLWTA